MAEDARIRADAVRAATQGTRLDRSLPATKNSTSSHTETLADRMPESVGRTSAALNRSKPAHKLDLVVEPIPNFDINLSRLSEVSAAKRVGAVQQESLVG